MGLLRSKVEKGAGILYAVGVGPGDPELLTIKAVKVIKEADVIACPAKDSAPGIAFNIASEAFPEITEKELLLLDFPMKDSDLTMAHQKAAESIMDVLRTGKCVAFLTLGDPGFYSTFSYVSGMISEEGYRIEIVSGVPSFCSVSARLNVPIAVGREAVMITTGEFRDFDGTLVILKAGSKLKSLKESIMKSGRQAWLVENCGMEEERIYMGVDAMPDEAGYYSTLIVK